MPRKLAVFPAAAALAVFAAAPASAHQEHESCAGGAPGVAEEEPGLLPVPPGPQFGPFVRGLANQRLADDAVVAIHTAFCEPHAPGE